MNSTSNFLAADLGASSGKIFAGCWNGTSFDLHELHRFANGPVNILGSLHWDILRLWMDLKEGLCGYRRKFSAPPAAIGIDGWGVDFALLDAAGRLLGNPYHYRDARTFGVSSAAFARVSAEEMFCQTGVRSWQINTLFQLFSMVQSRDPQLHAATTLLMIPDLFAHWLGGERQIEYTIGSTSQMLRKGTCQWAYDLLNRIGIPTDKLPNVCAPGTVLGSLRNEVGEEVGFRSAPPVIAVAAHDTASAVAAIPGMDAESVFISSGTWSLMGVETSSPNTTPEALGLGFTNEGGAGGCGLLIRNLTGLWLLQECMRQWNLRGEVYTWESLLMLAEKTEPFRSLIDPEVDEFLAPHDMLSAIRSFCRRTGQPAPETAGEFARCCMESLSLQYRTGLDSLEKLTCRTTKTVRVVGGGCENRLLCQFTADATRRVVVAGPVEASGFGNVMVQAIASGRLSDIAQGREAVAASVRQVVFEPRPNDAWEEGYHRFQSVSA
ncbi:MAG TPA: rhamnulokinase family protein [Terriglobia bacterium]|nr:rhamnulokinase family protein [Terriglobia bacterium]